jgi:hypothetical protein
VTYTEQRRRTWLDRGVPASRFERLMLSLEMKLLVEIVLAIIAHPIIFILCWINILSRSDLSGLKKLLWMLITILWGIGPILYLLLADGSFW